MFVTQRNLYYTDLHLGLALGVTQILGLVLGEILTLGVSTNARPKCENVTSQCNIGLKPIFHQACLGCVGDFALATL